MARAIANQAAVAMVNARTVSSIRQSERELAAVRRIQSILGQKLPALAESVSTDVFLSDLADTVCRAFGAVSCVAVAGGCSAGVTGNARAAGQGKAHVAVARAPLPSDLAVTLTLVRPPTPPIRELLDLVVTFSAVCLSRTGDAGGDAEPPTPA